MLSSSGEALLDQDKLLSTFLDAVKKCQVRFGGRTELATEGDPCVAKLCESLEEILTHGLRTQSSSRGIKAIRHVKDFMTSGLNLHLSNAETDKPVLWWFIRELLTHHEYQRFILLKNLSSDRGRGKAWLRSLLNEHSLERYIHIMLSEREILDSWYEPSALLRDQEKAAMLPNLAAGLDSILFAINIDNELLDSGLAAKKCIPIGVPEPSLAPVLPEDSPVMVQKSQYKTKKRKVPSQLVSFDDDDDCRTICKPVYHSAPTTCVNSPAAFTAKCSPYGDSIGRGFVPSSSCSTTQQSPCSTRDITTQLKCLQLKSGSDQSSSKDTKQNSGLTTMSAAPIDLMPLSPDGEMLFDFNSAECGSLQSSQGDSETFSLDLPREMSASSGNSVPSTVTASSFSSLTVEELRAAVLEISRSRDTMEEKRAEMSAALSLEMETSSTLRAQLAHESSTHKESLDKITLKVNSLSRENELLRHQLKKYVGAVQMLKREGAEGVSCSEASKKAPDLRDYHDEAMAYESKLIQVAEMHGELIEFNERLQKILRLREAQVHHLREELVDLRGPLPLEVDLEDDAVSMTSDYDLTNAPRTLINVWIPTAFLSGPTSDTHHVYQIYVRIRDDEWNVYRRFAQFHELHRRLKKTFAMVRTFAFPHKKTFGNKDTSVVEDRRLCLQQYLRQVVNVLVSTQANLAADPDKASLTEALSFLSDSQSQKGPAAPRRPASRNLFSRLSSNRQEPTQPAAPQYNGL